MSELRIGSQSNHDHKPAVKKTTRPVSSSGNGGVGDRNKNDLIDIFDTRVYSPKRKLETTGMLYRALDRLHSLLNSNKPLEDAPRGYYLDIFI